LPIPGVLDEMKKFLISDDLILENRHADGRLNSSVNEEQVLESLRKKFKIEEPNAREWYDFIAVHNGERFPVNIKVSNLDTADNVQCKLGIYYALTGIWPDFGNGVSWETFFKTLKGDLSKGTQGDYYFLIVGKSDPKDIILTSLKQIGSLVPNGNNLPFQCNWGRNRELKQRSHDDAVKFILGVLGKSCELRANIKSEFEKYLAGYI
jgi:hypothetical protein